MVALEEQELLARLQQPATRSQAFEAVVRTYQRMLYYHIRRLVPSHDDADDVLQNTFLKAWRGIDGFRAASSLKTWLYRIATNEALTLLEKQKRRVSQDLVHDHYQAPQEMPLDSDALQQHLDTAIRSLPKRQRTIFQMRYYDELRYEEIAEVLDVSVGALKASYHHAVRKIEKYLETATAR
ncbi:MAG: RNA polymerase sigma factor [Bacteroidia bacterium]